MKKIELFEKAIAENANNLEERGINGTMFWAYRNSLRAGCEDLNFSEVIWEYDVEPIVKTCKEAGVEKFTISSTFSSLIETLWQFEKAGCKMGELKQVPTGFTKMNFDTFKEEKEFAPAITIYIL